MYQGSMRDPRCFPNFGKLNAEVLGVSGDSVASHKKFTENMDCQFTLLADEKKEAIGLYGIAARTLIPY